MRYVIGSGWWCAQDSDERHSLFGDDVIRSRDFHRLWYASIDKYTSPEKIIIVDSCSPVRPELNDRDPRLEFISLSLNAGHNTCHTGKYCGWIRAVLLGMEYAMQCGADYYVYVEQDALLFGDGIVEHCISKMTRPVMLGSGAGTPQKIQQSMFIIRHDAVRRFMHRIHQIDFSDKEVSPEEKFHIAASRGAPRLLAGVHRRAGSGALFKWLDWQAWKYLRDYDVLPFGYGRARPIDFGDAFFYLQHGDRAEIDSYLQRSGLAWP